MDAVMGTAVYVLLSLALGASAGGLALGLFTLWGLMYVFNRR